VTPLRCALELGRHLGKLQVEAVAVGGRVDERLLDVASKDLPPRRQWKHDCSGNPGAPAANDVFMRTASMAATDDLLAMWCWPSFIKSTPCDPPALARSVAFHRSSTS